MSDTTDPHVLLQMNGLSRRMWDLGSLDRPHLFTRFTVSADRSGVGIQERVRDTPRSRSRPRGEMTIHSPDYARSLWNGLVRDGHLVTNYAEEKAS